ncbi:MAG: fatty acid desaturase [Chitinophagaceae bacterium]|nr:fatty acid desaturase [Chitinophagaceae bacterium]MBL0305811.1 fatty acid desaturase [Chitinophagaceae bacterium]HQV59531.1 fatty acid desaturase [Chitinophagaceae bacterium]HQV85747.1 fatty acid desaturase [Chitinophagaceae bacterium]HQX72225.1 fatty acid desaturase [Chitinophagaceae bacterium]
MKALTVITDPVYVEPKEFTGYEKFWLKYINDKRDLPFIHLLTAIHILVIPVAILLYTPVLQSWYWWLVYIPYFYVSQMYFKGRFGLMLHCISHRKLFKKGYTWLYNYVIWFVCPFFGHTPETYFAHHMGMHHVENNMLDDASSTLPYQRDSIRGFLSYVGRFLILGFEDTFMYFFKRKRKKFYMRLTAGEISFYLFCVGMSFVNFKATLFIFIIPFVFARIVMMLGNWAQHAFVNLDDLEDNTINCINTKYNQMCWNDGYHAIHHVRPAMHYTDIPGEFLKTKDQLAEKKVLVFDGIHYLHIFLWLMTKRYDKLADNLVNINNMFNSKEEAIDLMKQRTRKYRMTA